MNFATRGWIGMTWPTRYGGGGTTYVDRLCVTEMLLAAGAPLAAHWFGDRQVGPSILAWGSEVQKQCYLPEILAGDVTYCIGTARQASRCTSTPPRAGSRRRQRVRRRWHINFIGAIGFTEEYGLGRLTQRLRVLRYAYGDDIGHFRARGALAARSADGLVGIP